MSVTLSVSLILLFPILSLIFLFSSTCIILFLFFFFFFNDTATTEIYTLSLHDALPILLKRRSPKRARRMPRNCRQKSGIWREFSEPSSCLSIPIPMTSCWPARARPGRWRSEEHTSELQSHSDLVCRLLLEKKKNKKNRQNVGYLTHLFSFDEHIKHAENHLFVAVMDS